MNALISIIVLATYRHKNMHLIIAHSFSCHDLEGCVVFEVQMYLKGFFFSNVDIERSVAMSVLITPTHGV